MPWISFCISTYKRPEILHKQLLLLLQQTYEDFEIVISDNDPDGSAEKVIEIIADPRLRYFKNRENIGIIKSFNNSIKMAVGEFIVPVTDDDPIDANFLEFFRHLYHQHPGFSIYCGFKRTGKEEGEIEFISRDSFLPEVLDPMKTPNLLWSSTLMRRMDVIKTGSIPDFGSPHLADHAFIVQVGSVNGGVIVNRMFSSLTSHDSNFSKLNFEFYVTGCEGFYHHLVDFFSDHPKLKHFKRAILNHLARWFIAVTFNLKKYYTITKYNPVLVTKVNDFASEILNLPFMSRYLLRYKTKNLIFKIKRSLHLLR
jgi:glycosyltransferase involved in cell wall biosynthesis